MHLLITQKVAPVASLLSPVTLSMVQMENLKFADQKKAIQNVSNNFFSFPILNTIKFPLPHNFNVELAVTCFNKSNQ